jgi:hypothetical protein
MPEAQKKQCAQLKDSQPAAILKADIPRKLPTALQCGSENTRTSNSGTLDLQQGYKGT